MIAPQPTNAIKTMTTNQVVVGAFGSLLDGTGDIAIIQAIISQLLETSIMDALEKLMLSTGLTLNDTTHRLQENAQTRGLAIEERRLLQRACITLSQVYTTRETVKQIQRTNQELAEEKQKNENLEAAFSANQKESATNKKEFDEYRKSTDRAVSNLEAENRRSDRRFRLSDKKLARIELVGGAALVTVTTVAIAGATGGIGLVAEGVAVAIAFTGPAAAAGVTALNHNCTPKSEEQMSLWDRAFQTIEGEE